MFGFLKKTSASIEPSSNSLVNMVCNPKIKLGTHIVVPHDTMAYLTYHDDIYNELAQGEYVLDATLLQKYFAKIKKPSKKKINSPLPKTFALDIFFVLIGANKQFEFNTNVKKYKYLDESKGTLSYTTSVSYTLVAPKKFLSWICSEVAIVSDNQAEKLLNMYIRDDTREYVNRTPLPSPESNINEKYLSKLLIFLNDEYKEIGVAFNTLSISKNTASFFDKKTNVAEIKPVPDVVIPEPSLPRLNDAIKYCPKCESAIIVGAEYCHKCGIRIKE